jgi:hypothetical protein
VCVCGVMMQPSMGRYNANEVGAFLFFFSESSCDKRIYWIRVNK